MTSAETATPRVQAIGKLFAAALLALLAIAVGGLVAADRAEAQTGIESWTVNLSGTQAGGHPDVDLDMKFYNRIVGPEGPDPKCECDDVRIIRNIFPEGFIGNPHAVPKCTLTEFGLSECPPESQVGIVSYLGGLQVPVYNMVPHPDEAGLLAFKVILVEGPSFVELSGRTEGDLGLNAESSPIFHLIPIQELQMHLWGTPALEKWDKNRWPTPQPPICQVFAQYPEPCFAPVDSNVPPVPYLQSPTKCGGELTAILEIEYYNGALERAEAPWPATTGCDQLSFNPSLSALPTTKQADTASGLDVNLRVPQPQSPLTPTPSAIKAVTVRLPEGLTLNPNAADGRTTCTDAEAGFGTRNASVCPESSKVGTVRVDTTALPAPIFGAIYLGSPLAGDKYRIFLTASGFATNIKLAGTARPDPQTGRLIVSFGQFGSPNLPQAPFSEFDMHFFGSERGLLATPEQCGTYPVQTEFVPWNDALPNQTATSFFTIESGPNGSECPPDARPFSPAVKAGSADSSAGRYSSFAFKLDRRDGDQLLSTITVATPKGFSASLRGVAYCPEEALNGFALATHTGLAEQSSPLCPAASQIGTAWATTGAGSQPLHTPGRVYLAGPYKGAPLSLVVVVPAVSGPYDLGNVVVRAAVSVDRETAEITTVSDSLPQVLDGIPLRMRTVFINLDRTNFALNPSSCLPRPVSSQITGDRGAASNLATHYQASNCSDLGFRPRFRLRLRGAMKRTGHPTLTTRLTTRPGDANLDRVEVTLPGSQQLDNANIKSPCTRAQFAAANCPASSVQGTATAVTQLLDEPLRGPVYLVTGNNKLPDLVASLKGQVNIDLRGRIDTVKGRLRTTFATVPDVPVTSFTLRMRGGQTGLLVNNRNLCAAPNRAALRMRAQNNRRSNSNPIVAVSCRKGRR